jgi:hypothetical protein
MFAMARPHHASATGPGAGTCPGDAVFVDVALLPELAGAIAPLIDKRSTPLLAAQFKVAVFCSISNCQPGLCGVSLGNVLFKRKLPQLKTFCTLLPIPGLMAWRTMRRGASPPIAWFTFPLSPRAIR